MPTLQPAGAANYKLNIVQELESQGSCQVLQKLRVTHAKECFHPLLFSDKSTFWFERQDRRHPALLHEWVSFQFWRDSGSCGCSVYALCALLQPSPHCSKVNDKTLGVL